MRDLLVAAYRDDGFPATIVRPSATYDKTKMPLAGGWTALRRRSPRSSRGAAGVSPGIVPVPSGQPGRDGPQAALLNCRRPC
ncbi:MAG: hypothetical protein ACLPN6_25660 [Streptosporangiaceae bacterium]